MTDNFEADAEDPWVLDTFEAPLPLTPTASLLAEIAQEVGNAKPVAPLVDEDDDRLRPPGTTHLGAHVRKTILDYVDSCERGWAYFTEIGEALGIDRSTALHHGTLLAKQGLGVLAQAKRMGQGGRPPKILISAERYEDIPLYGTTYEITPSGERDEYEYVLTAVPVYQDDPETPARTSRGPLTKALEGNDELSDELTTKIADKLAEALFSGVASGKFRLRLTIDLEEVKETEAEDENEEGGDNA